MATNPTPEFYLSLLSGRYGDGSDISPEQRHNDVSRLTGHPFPNDPDRLMDLLDALAAICVRKAKGEVFFLSLAIDLNAATLYVSSNEPVPDTVGFHLRKIRGQLKDFKKVVEVDPSIQADIKSSPDPNNTQARMDELELQKTIYKYSYSKLRQRFAKRAPAILAQYETVMTSLQANAFTEEDTTLLIFTPGLLERIARLLQPERPPDNADLTLLIQTIDLLSLGWRKHLKAVGDESILTHWDNSIYVKRERGLSLRRLLEKLFTLHHHIRTITRIAWSGRLAGFLEGKFYVVSVPAGSRKLLLKLSEQTVLPIIFPRGGTEKWPIKKMVYDKLLERLQVKADEQGIDIKTGTLSMQVKVHAESILLAYHLQHPETDPYHYFGGSKLSCHGCGTFFSSFNVVAASLGYPQFFTKGCHNKIYLRWSCPPLVSQVQPPPAGPSLDTQVRTGMVTTLNTELAAYVDELRAVVEGPSRPLSDSTAASGDSRESDKTVLEQIKAAHHAERAFAKGKQKAV